MKKPQSLPHVVSLNTSRLTEAIRNTKAEEFTYLVFLLSFTRNENPVPKYSHKQLAKRIGRHPRHVRWGLDVLEAKGIITREVERRWEVTTINVVTTKENAEETEKVILLRVGPLQYKRWRQARGALRTALMLGAHIDRNGMILNGKTPLADFIHKKVGVSVSAANNHIATLKEARILHGYNERKGLKGNQKRWFIDEFILSISDNKRLEPTTNVTDL